MSTSDNRQPVNKRRLIAAVAATAHHAKPLRQAIFRTERRLQTSGKIKRVTEIPRIAVSNSEVPAPTGLMGRTRSVDLRLMLRGSSDDSTELIIS